MTQTVKLVAKATVTGELEIEPINGFSAQEVADLLNSGRAYVSGQDVYKPAPPPAEGMTPVARVVRQKTDKQPLLWTVSQ